MDPGTVTTPTTVLNPGLKHICHIFSNQISQLTHTPHPHDRTGLVSHKEPTMQTAHTAFLSFLTAMVSIIYKICFNWHLKPQTQVHKHVKCFWTCVQFTFSVYRFKVMKEKPLHIYSSGAWTGSSIAPFLTFKELCTARLIHTGTAFYLTLTLHQRATWR